MSTLTSEVYVWVWLPGRDQPVPAGVLAPARGVLAFRYGDRYLQRPDAISLYGPELPLDDQWHQPVAGMPMPSCLRDSAPDAWGRRVILDQLLGKRGQDADTDLLDETTYLLESASNRIGGVDFQRNPTRYVPRGTAGTLDDLQDAARLLDEGRPIPPEIAKALYSGTAIGGARPKAILNDGQNEWVAKFAATGDTLPFVNLEAAAIFMARRAGIDVPDMQVVTSLGRDVLLTRRFDRTPDGGRRIVVSALTMLGVSEMDGLYATYPQILAALRAQGARNAGEDLYRRIAFNMAISNTDDHVRNHAAFWDGHHLELTPAYDLSPSIRRGDSSRLALAFDAAGHRDSRFADLIEAAPEYGLSRPQGRAVVDALVDSMRESWKDAADAARLTTTQRDGMWGTEFLNPAVFYGD